MAGNTDSDGCAVCTFSTRNPLLYMIKSDDFQMPALAPILTLTTKCKVKIYYTWSPLT